MALKPWSTTVQLSLMDAWRPRATNTRKVLDGDADAGVPELGSHLDIAINPRVGILGRTFFDVFCFVDI